MTIGTRIRLEASRALATYLAKACMPATLFLLSCDRGPSTELVNEYGQVEYAQFASPIHRDLVHDIPGLNLWRITPFKSAANRNFIVGTTDDARGKVIESPAIFRQLYKHNMSAEQAAELSIEILNDSLTPGVRHALTVTPHTMIGYSLGFNQWIQSPHFEDGSVVYWTDVENRCYEASTNLTTGVLSRREFDCRAAPQGGLDAGDAALVHP